MNNQLWIFVAVAGVVAAAALWGGWLWVRKKVRLSEQFQRDTRKEIGSLRQHVETLEGKALVAVRQQVESLDMRQSRDENQRSVEISGLRGQLDGLSTKESEAQIREALGAVRQQVEDLDARQSREESSRAAGISGLHLQLTETLSAVRLQVEGLEERQSRDENQRSVEISGLRGQLDGLSTKESEAQIREALGTVRQQVADLDARQSREENNQVKEILDLHAKLDGLSTKESEAQVREMLSVVHQQVKKIQEEQARGKKRADMLLTEETGARLVEIFGRVCHHIDAILGALGNTIVKDGEETPPKSWEVSSHTVCLPLGSETDSAKISIATALNLEEYNDEHQRWFVGDFQGGDVQMREIEIDDRQGLKVTVWSTEEEGDTSSELGEQVDRVLGALCQISTDADANLRACVHHFLHGEVGTKALLGQMHRQDRDLPLVALAQGENRTWSENYMVALCEEFAGAAMVFRLDHSASECMKEDLGEAKACFDGAVRIYGPKWRPHDPPEAHPFLLWRAFGEKIHHGKMIYKDSFQRIRSKFPKEKPDATSVPTPKRLPVQQLVAQAQEDFDAGLLFGDVVFEAASKLDPATGAQKVYENLSVLNDLAKIRRRGESLGCDEIQWLKERNCTVSRESESGANSGLHTWPVEGVPMEFDKHAKPKTHTTAAQCARIYYEWDEQRQKIVIGWVGRHP